MALSHLSVVTPRYIYALAPLTWVTADDGLGVRWTPPAGTAGWLDLRPLPSQAIKGGTPQGRAFVAARQAPSNAAIVANSSHLAVEAATTRMRDAWLSECGYRPSGLTLLDLVWDHLTSGADPDGQAGPKPLMPDSKGNLALYLDGHSLVRSVKFEWGDAYTNTVQAVLHRQFTDEWERNQDHARRVMDFWCQRFRVSDWTVFVPKALHAHVPGRLPHQTTLTESFNTANSTTLGPDQTWSEFADGASGECFEVSGNQALCNTAGSTINAARVNADLSSSDHYAQVIVTQLGSVGENRQFGATCRFSAAAVTFYGCRAIRSLDGYQVFKMVSGTLTGLGSIITITIALPQLAKIQADGSTLQAWYAGVQTHNFTDTSIAGNLRAGICGYNDVSAKGDSWEAADVLVAGGQPTMRRFGRQPMGLRGVRIY